MALFKAVGSRIRLFTLAVMIEVGGQMVEKKTLPERHSGLLTC